MFMLAILLPLQPLVAAEADFAHLMQDQHSREKTIDHIIEHIHHVAHHHEADGSSHENNSNQSSSHLLTCDSACSLTMLPVAEQIFVTESFAESVPIFVSDAYQGHAPPPVTKPPLQPL